MAVVTAAITGVAALGVGVASLVSSKNAADNAKDASLQALQMQIDERKRITEAATAAARMSPNEIKSINDLLTTKGAGIAATQQSIDKQQADLDAMDPQVKAAGAELYKTLTGEATKVLAPIENRLQRQRSERMSQLQAQLGPGFMTSSAGIEAMNKFDTDSAIALNQVQQNYLTNISQAYLGLAGQENQAQASITDATGNLFANAANIDKAVLGAYQNESQRVTNAQLGAPGTAPVDFTMPTQVAFNSSNAFSQNLMGLGAGLGKVAGNFYGKNSFANSNSGDTQGGYGSNLLDMDSAIKNVDTNTFATGKLA